MNAHPHSVPLAYLLEAPSQPEASGFAQHLMQVATALLPLFETGRTVDAAAPRAAIIRVQPAFKQGAKDRGVDIGPIQT